MTGISRVLRGVVAGLDTGLIERILSHLKGKEPSTEVAMLSEERLPPQTRLFD